MEVGLGVAGVASIEILWPSGVDSRFLVDADRFITIDESRLVTGDIDGNHAVGFSDLSLVLQKWGPCDGLCPTDINEDGATGFADLITVVNNWG